MQTGLLQSTPKDLISTQWGSDARHLKQSVGPREQRGSGDRENPKGDRENEK